MANMLLARSGADRFTIEQRVRTLLARFGERFGYHPGDPRLPSPKMQS